MRQEPPNAAMRAEVLQMRLDAATWALAAARRERSDAGCVSTIGGCGSCFAMLVGIGFTLCARETAFVGIIICIAAIAGFVRSVKTSSARPPSQDDADRLLLAVGTEVGPADTLRIDSRHRTLLHEHLYVASAPLAVAILRILGVVGNKESLRIARSLARITDGQQDVYFTAVDVEMFVAGRNADVKLAAAEAAAQIKARLDLAERSSTLLRASGTADERELLRPAGASETDPSLLLRTTDDPAGDEAPNRPESP